MIVLALASLLSLAVERGQELNGANAQVRQVLETPGETDVLAISRLQTQISESTQDFITYIVVAIVYTVLLFSVAAIVEAFGRDDQGNLRGLGMVMPAVVGALSLFVVWRLAL